MIFLQLKIIDSHSSFKLGFGYKISAALLIKCPISTEQFYLRLQLPRGGGGFQIAYEL